MAEESPVVRLTNAVLLGALNKSATTIIVRPGVVELVIDGKLVVELEPPSELHQSLVRRLAVMADVPSYSTDQYGCGRIEIAHEDRPEHAYFDITVRGHGPNMRAQIAVHGFVERAPPFTPPGVQLDEFTR